MARPFATRVALVLGGTAAALFVWVVSVPLLGIELTVAVPAGLAAGALPGRDVVGSGQVATVASGAGVLAWAFVVVVERITRHAHVVWLSCALPALILSLSGPLTATTAAAMVCLAGMHLAVGVVLIPGLALIPAPRREGAGPPDIQNTYAAGPTDLTRRAT
jgi:hypothetical protein